ncbi:proline-rich protein HaeIII subfamily 1-like [Ochotona curzoniae]|uniref:proline-rich protein HaeIII subfamily 1-like n=1 Tax=Ochotona curzoniae TaxID=130825 RepID=UPI001B349919|nr:proline-rich protein HaeIII subfamily 1-like [Ochotona curzoniae]
MPPKYQTPSGSKSPRQRQRTQLCWKSKGSPSPQMRRSHLGRADKGQGPSWTLAKRKDAGGRQPGADSAVACTRGAGKSRGAVRGSRGPGGSPRRGLLWALRTPGSAPPPPGAPGRGARATVRHSRAPPRPRRACRRGRPPRLGRVARARRPRSSALSPSEAARAAASPRGHGAGPPGTPDSAPGLGTGETGLPEDRAPPSPSSACAQRAAGPASPGPGKRPAKPPAPAPRQLRVAPPLVGLSRAWAAEDPRLRPQTCPPPRGPSRKLETHASTQCLPQGAGATARIPPAPHPGVPPGLPAVRTTGAAGTQEVWG